MGDKRISTRTLPDGTKVLHHPPDKRHPDGMLTMVREGSPLRDKLAAQRAEKQERHAAIHEGHKQRIAVKVAAQQANGLPGEKSPI